MKVVCSIDPRIHIKTCAKVVSELQGNKQHNHSCLIITQTSLPWMQKEEETAQKSDGGFNQTKMINMDIMKITVVKVEVTESH